MPRDEILDTRKFFSGIRIWPSQPGSINPEGWLKNFSSPDDIVIATALLDSFVYIDGVQVTRMVESAFHGLSYGVEQRHGVGRPVGDAWREFLDHAIVSYPAGSDRDATASGHIFIRAVRKALVEDETRLLDLGDTVVTIAKALVPPTVVLVDDFAGTGTQFLESWRREFTVPGGSNESLETLASAGKIDDLFYIPAISTLFAHNRIEAEAPFVRVKPAHILPNEYSAADPNTKLVPAELAHRLEPFLRKHAPLAGYPVSAVYGYGNMGLAIAFEHSIPDNTLPIFYAENANWKTLRRRNA